jgi:hypothetical protein
LNTGKSRENDIYELVIMAMLSYLIRIIFASLEKELECNELLWELLPNMHRSEGRWNMQPWRRRVMKYPVKDWIFECKENRNIYV